jgi:ribonuclease D
VFVFDVLALNAQKTMKELKEILENEHYLKIVHESRLLIDNLKYNYNVKIAGIFDLHSAAAQFHQHHEIDQVEKCIKAVLGLDIEIFEDEGFVKRPITQETLTNIASKVGYHLALYNKLAQKSFANLIQSAIGNSSSELFADITTA